MDINIEVKDIQFETKNLNLTVLVPEFKSVILLTS